MEKVSISRICRHVSKNLAILLLVKNTYMQDLHPKLPIKQALREWIRQQIRDEFKNLDQWKHVLEKKSKPSFGVKKDSDFFCDRDLASDDFNKKLRMTFKDSIKYGCSERELKATLIQTAGEFYT